MLMKKLSFVILVDMEKHTLLHSLTLTQGLLSCLMLYTDLWDPAPILLSEGYRYYVTFVDDFNGSILYD